MKRGHVVNVHSGRRRELAPRVKIAENVFDRSQFVGEISRRSPARELVRRINRLFINLAKTLGSYVNPAIMIGTRPVFAQRFDVDYSADDLFFRIIGATQNHAGIVDDE